MFIAQYLMYMKETGRIFPVATVDNGKIKP